LLRAEKVIFYIIGALFFLAAFALSIRATLALGQLFLGPSSSTIAVATSFVEGCCWFLWRNLSSDLVPEYCVT